MRLDDDDDDDVNFVRCNFINRDEIDAELLDPTWIGLTLELITESTQAATRCQCYTTNYRAAPPSLALLFFERFHSQPDTLWESVFINIMVTSYSTK